MKQCVEVMIASPGLLRPERGDGFVFGVLKKKVEEVDAEEKDKDDKVKVVVDVERNAELVRLAGGLPCVFHRAFVCISSFSSSFLPTCVRWPVPA